MHLECSGEKAQNIKIGDAMAAIRAKAGGVLKVLHAAATNSAAGPDAKLLALEAASGDKPEAKDLYDIGLRLHDPTVSRSALQRIYTQLNGKKCRGSVEVQALQRQWAEKSKKYSR